MSAMTSVAHINKLTGTLGNMSSDHVFLFATACTERLWPVYVKSSVGKNWTQTIILRNSLDEIWQWLCQLRNRPALSQQCEDSIIDCGDGNDEAAAFQVSNSIYGLASIVEFNQPQYGYLAAQSNLEFIRSFLYEILTLNYSDDSEETVNHHKLIEKEIEIQNQDIGFLNQPYSSLLANTLRDKCVGKSILGNYWYTPEPT
jgi:Protein of unknown function (DUF416)